jgi:hypothetical protein
MNRVSQKSAKLVRAGEHSVNQEKAGIPNVVSDKQVHKLKAYKDQVYTRKVYL